jgi:asparagine synthase (glutamine-hydrolysing)
MLIRLNLPNSLLKLVFRLNGTEGVLGTKLQNTPLLDESCRAIPKNYSPLKKKLFRSHTGTLVDLLHYGDILSMQHGLEGRHPFMDHRLVEFVFQIQEEYLINNGEGKVLHKEAMRDLLPPYILENVHKVGFATPIHNLFDESDPHGVLKYINKHRKDDLFNGEVLSRLISEQQTGVEDHTRLLFRILSTLIWYEVNQIAE